MYSQILLLCVFTVQFPSLPNVGIRIEILITEGKRIASHLIKKEAEEPNLEYQPRGIYLVKTTIGLEETIN